LSVSDTGIGIKESELPFVFDRFYKSNNNVSGTGIGLALVRALVELQGGKVSVTSVYGKGTTFVMEMPIKQNAELQIAENIAVTTADDETMKTLSTEQISSPEGIKIEEMTEEETMSSSKPTVLVVDDNSDVRWYIRSLLGESYNLIDAADGNDGHIKARKYIPDIIICDVMMPVMDGLELCRLLKSEVETSHIPVIMLTARSLDDQKIEGFNYGADAYIPKPFNGKLLVARIENLLKNREILKSVSADKSKEGNESLSNIDKDFITRFREVVQEHLGDSEFGVEELGSELGFSRVQLYRKIKALTAYSPVELIRTARLKKAKRMIETTDMSVSEIAYSVGFTSPSYFTKCFKEYFNQNPNEVAKER
jgi:DNA-binding response OmpR family regulator